MTTFLLCVHVLSAIMGFGVVTTFPFLGAMSETQPKYSVALSKAIHTITTKVVYPAAVIQLLTGVFLIFSTHRNLTTNPWLGAAIILFVIALGISTGFMTPRERKLVGILETAGGGEHPAEAVALMDTLKKTGMFLTLILVVIIVLMVWKPGIG